MNTEIAQQLPLGHYGSHAPPALRIRERRGPEGGQSRPPGSSGPTGSSGHHAPAGQAWLAAGDRVTIALWARSYRNLHGNGAPGGVTGEGSAPAAPGASATGALGALPAWLAAAAVHAVLAGLRRCTDPAALFAAYADSAAAAGDFALIDSIVPLSHPDSAERRHQNDERRWQVRDAAFHVRWLELADADVPPAPAAREQCDP